MLQIGLGKAYDNVDWSFLSELMAHMGFGVRMSLLIYPIGVDAISYVMLNGGVTMSIPICKSMRQGCPLIPLLFAIVTHPILVHFHQLALDGVLEGLCLPSRKPCVAQALADDHIMFLGAKSNNIAKAM